MPSNTNLERLIDLETKSLEIISNSFINNQTISTTSFGLTSTVLIHLISKTNLDIPIVFIDTGFHFNETVDYYKSVVLKYPYLKFRKISAELQAVEFLEKYGKNIHKENPEFCCKTNKILPLDNLIESDNVRIWYAAIRKSQSPFRNSLDERIKLKNNLIKIHPLLLWTELDISNYMRVNSLPHHPLSIKGYESIGCYPCTKVGKNRSGRWRNSTKTECGLHFKNK